jgi:hypothetical protein
MASEYVSCLITYSSKSKDDARPFHCNLRIRKKKNWIIRKLFEQKSVKYAQWGKEIGINENSFEQKSVEGLNV